MIQLIAVGDIMLGANPLCPGRGVGSLIKKTGAAPVFDQVAPILRKGDIVFGNLEAVLSNYGVNRKHYKSQVLRASPQSVSGLSYAGFNVMSLANNHALEHGAEALKETINILRDSGIKYIGVGNDKLEARKPVIMLSDGIKIAFLAYCIVPDKTAYVSVDKPSEILDDVRKAKNEADIVIVSMHWGDEFIEYPSTKQVELGHNIIDSGATLIIGHHPHVLQGIERYNAGLIAYSLGNFVFDMSYIPESRQSVILRCLLSETGLVSYDLIPIYLDKMGVPGIPRDEGCRNIVNKIKTLSEPECFTNDQLAYQQMVIQKRKQAQRQMKKHFILDFFKCNPMYSSQIIVDYLRKKKK